MKKLTAFFLLLIFLFNTAGYFIVFKVEQLAIRNEVREHVLHGSADSRSIKVSLKEGTFSYADDENELVYQGKRYDILKKESRNGISSFVLLHDQEEEQLVSGLDNHISNFICDHPGAKKNQNDKKTKSSLDDFFVSNRCTVPASPVSLSLFISSTEQFNSADLLAFTPPPKLS